MSTIPLKQQPRTDETDSNDAWTVADTTNLGGGKLFRVLRNEGEIKVQFVKEEASVKHTILAEMSIERFVLFRQCVDEASSNLDQVVEGKDIHYKSHLGGNMFLQVNSPYQGVSIRQFKNVGNSESVKLIPVCGAGIFLLAREWTQFLKLNECIVDIIPEVMTTLPCLDRIDHSNQEGYYMCLECCPNGENRYWF